jgi:hypothetical protein
MALTVKPKTLPVAGTDVVEITIDETYKVDGIGEDQVTLKGKLVGERTVPLLGFGETKESWDTSTVVAKFNKLELYGDSPVFGPVVVTLDDSVPAFGTVTNGKCAAALPVQVAMPKHNLVLKSEEPVQLRSDVQTVPPVGDERTESVRAVRLVNANTLRPMGSIEKARVSWRELTDQTVALHKDRVALGLASSGTVLGFAGASRDSGLEDRLSDLTNKVLGVLQELESIKTEQRRR